MSHHSSSGERPNWVKDLFDPKGSPVEKVRFGATGNFPEGKIADIDEGEIQFGVAHDKELV